MYPNFHKQHYLQQPRHGRNPSTHQQMTGLKDVVSKVKVAQLCPNLCDPMNYTVLGILQARILNWVAFPFSRGSSQPRDQIQVSHIAGGFLPGELQGKPKNTGLGSLSLIQQIVPTQKSNQGLPHCRWILYQLSYQQSPLIYICIYIIYHMI